MQVKLATQDLRKLKLFWTKCYDVISFAHDVTIKNLSRNSNYIIDVIFWQKIGNSSISIREVIINSILSGFN